MAPLRFQLEMDEWCCHELRRSGRKDYSQTMTDYVYAYQYCYRFLAL
jgi:hypothetical protein